MSLFDQHLDDPRLAITESVVSCENCTLHAQCSGPVPFYGPSPSTIAIIGEAPGEEEDTAGRPFIGPAGQMIRKHLTEVGIDPEAVFWCNTVSCWPHGTPKAEHVEACRTNVADQLNLAKPKWVLLLGKTALQAWRPDIEIGHGRSRPFWPRTQSPEITFFATYHPAAALRKRVYEMELHDDVVKFAEMVAKDDAVPFVPDACTKCTDPWSWIDDDGFTWCANHAGPEFAERMAFIRSDYEAACRRLAKKGTAA